VRLVVFQTLESLACSNRRYSCLFIRFCCSSEDRDYLLYTRTQAELDLKLGLLERVKQQPELNLTSQQKSRRATVTCTYLEAMISDHWSLLSSTGRIICRSISKICPCPSRSATTTDQRQARQVEVAAEMWKKFPAHSSSSERLESTRLQPT